MPSQRLILFTVWSTTAFVIAGCAATSQQKVDDGIVAGRQLSLRGIEAMQRGQWGDAEAWLSDAVRKCPMDERMRCQYAETLWNLNARDEAIRHMEFAVRLSGGNAELLVRLGDMYLEQGKLDLASNQAELAIAANRQMASAWALRGDVLRERGDSENSLAAYHRALSLSGHYPRVQLAIADMYQMQGRYNRALATLRNLADGYPPGEVPGAIYYLEGLAQKNMRRYSDAIASFRLAKRTDPTPDVYYQLAETRLLQGDPANARIAINDALRVAPGHVPSLELLARMNTPQHRLTSLHSNSSDQYNR